jgi:hypothetical protein
MMMKNHPEFLANQRLGPAASDTAATHGRQMSICMDDSGRIACE